MMKKLIFILFLSLALNCQAEEVGNLTIKGDTILENLKSKSVLGTNSDGTIIEGTDANTTYTAGDALTLTGTDFDFDGGATPSGDLGGTWASPSVNDDSHAHTTTTLSGIDIGDDTNLAAGRSLTLSGDSVEADSELYTDFKGITIETPTDADNFFAFEAALALTVTRVHGIVESATSCVVTWQECDSAGDNCSTIESVTADVDGVISTDIDNASIDAGDMVRVVVGTVTGTVGHLNSTITFTKND